MTSCICKSGRQWTDKILYTVTAAQRVWNAMNYTNVTLLFFFCAGICSLQIALTIATELLTPTSKNFHERGATSYLLM